MGAAILKGAGMAVVLAGGAFALFQANSAVEGSLAAAAPAPVAPPPTAPPTRTAQTVAYGLPDDFPEAFPDEIPDDFADDPSRPAAAPGAARPADPAPSGEADFGAFGDPFSAPAAATSAPADDWPALDDELDAAPTPRARRVTPLLDWPAEEPVDSSAPAAPAPIGPAPVSPAGRPATDGFDFDSWIDEPADRSAPERPTEPARSEPRAPVPTMTQRRPAPESFDFQSDRPADAAVQLRVAKQAPNEARPGEPFVYTIRVTNPGGVAARSVVVEEPIPAGVELEGTDPRADLDGRTLRWSLGDLPGGGERELNVKVVPTAAGTVGSVTVVRCDLSAAARTRVLAPRLELVVQPTGDVRAGRPFELRMTVSNAGTADAAGASVRTLLPEGVAHASGERDLEYDLGPLSAGQTREVSLTVVASNPGPAEFRCELTAADATPAPAVAAVEVGRRQLTLTRNGPRTRFVSRTGSWRNVVTNASDAPAPPARVVESVPAGFSFASATGGGRFDPESRTVSWEVPALPPGRSAELGVELTADAAGQLESVVVLETAGRPEAELVAATDVRGYTAVAPRVDGLNGPLAVGERVVLVVTLENSGTEAASNLFADLNLPAAVRALGFFGEGLDAEETDRGLRIVPRAPLAAGESLKAEVMIEAAQKGNGSVELSVSADHLPEPARRTQPVRVYADAE